MPKIPDFFVPSVEQTPVRLPQPQAQQIVPFQPMQTEQLTKLSEAMEAAGTGLSRAYAVVQDDENDAIAKDLDIQLKIKLDDMLENPETGFLAATGPNAGLDQYNRLLGDAQKLVEDSFADFKDGGKYERDYYKPANGMYKGVAMQRLDTFKTRAAEHARANIRDYASKMSEARWMMHSDDAAKYRSGWDSEKADQNSKPFYQALVAARTEAASIAARTAGNDPSSVEYQAIYKAKMGQTHSAVVTNFLIGGNPDVESASKYIAAHAYDMTDQDRAKLQEATQDRVPIAEGFKAFRAVMSDKSLTTMNERRERLNQMMEKGELTSVKSLDDAMGRLNNQEKYDERNQNELRAETWVEFSKPDNATKYKSIQDVQREDPNLYFKLEQYGLMDNAIRQFAGKDQVTSEEVEKTFGSKTAEALAQEYPFEKDLRAALAGRSSPGFLEGTVNRWASVSKNATKEAAAAGKTHQTVMGMAESSLSRQKIWDYISTGRKDEPTKEAVVNEYVAFVEKRIRNRKGTNELPTEKEMQDEMLLLEETRFRTLDKSDHFWTWDGEENLKTPYGFRVFIRSGQAAKSASVDAVRYTFPDKRVATISFEDATKRRRIVWGPNTIGLSVKEYNNVYDALEDLNRFLVDKNEKTFNLEEPSGFFEAYEVLERLLNKGKK